MKLKRLELLGFKSFCERTFFLFDDGITSIVGPNGCGKSNIVDAILWVLGERGVRTLRVRDMEDVIFHGSDGRKGVGIAEVTLYLSDDSEEYTVRRRIFKDGTNEYFLNGKPVRLRDIQELFLGKGIGVNTYAIIEQGKIESFIQMKPKERKLLIEEAGGITRYKEKKEEALLRLEEVRNNLLRVEDLKREVESALKKAEVEYERWKKYRELSERKREIEIRILAIGLEKVNETLAKLQKRSNSLRAELERIEDEGRASQELLRTKEEEISLCEKAVKDLEVSLRVDEREIEAILKEINRLKERRDELLRASEDVKGKLKNLKERLNTTESEIEKAYSSLKHLESLINKGSSEIFKLMEILKEKEEEVRKAEEDYEIKRNELFSFASNLSEKKNRILDLERRKGEIERRRAKYEEEKRSLESKISELKAKLEWLNERLYAKREELKLLDDEKEEVERRYEAFSSEVSKIEAKLNLLLEEKRVRENLLKELGGLKRKDQPQRFGRQLMDVIKVDRESERILKKYFLRELSFYILEGEIESILGDLPEDGNYVFFTDRGLFIKEGDGVRLNLKHAQTEKEALRRITEGEEGIFVCKDSILDSRGLLLKRGYDGDHELGIEMERRKVERELSEIGAKIEGLSLDLKGRIEEKKKVEGRLFWLRKRREEVSVDLENLNRELAVVEAMIRECTDRLSTLVDVSEIDYDPELSKLDELKRELDLMLSKRLSMEEELKTVHDRLSKERVALREIEQRIKHKEMELNKSKAEYDRIQVELAKKSNYLSLLKDEEESLKERLKGVEEEKLRIEAQLMSLEGSYAEKKDRVEAIAREVEELKMSLGSLHEERFEISKRIKNLEIRRENLKSRFEEIGREIILQSERRERLLELLKNTYSVYPENLKVGGKTIEELEKERASLEDEITGLGEINFRAQRDYEETLSRLQFLEREKEDLEMAIDSLRKTIDRVDSLSKQIFSETLSKVSKYYGDFVKKLFGGGEGYLSFNQSLDGVEMYVKPKGKKVTTLEMLSGGEKALASASLLFALISTNPPPFCLMDEIDAPLDDASLGSFLDVVRELSKSIQIIFITHNRLTMEASGTIYGITMEEDGVSKVVSVRLARDSLKK